jgi:hypothetical protein
MAVVREIDYLPGRLNCPSDQRLPLRTWGLDTSPTSSSQELCKLPLTITKVSKLQRWDRARLVDLNLDSDSTHHIVEKPGIAIYPVSTDKYWMVRTERPEATERFLLTEQRIPLARCISQYRNKARSHATTIGCRFNPAQLIDWRSIGQRFVRE